MSEYDVKISALVCDKADEFTESAIKRALVEALVNWPDQNAPIANLLRAIAANLVVRRDRSGGSSAVPPMEER